MKTDTKVLPISIPANISKKKSMFFNIFSKPSPNRPIKLTDVHISSASCEHFSIILPKRRSQSPNICYFCNQNETSFTHYCYMKSTLLLNAMIVGVALAANADEGRLLRFPATNGTDVVFSYAGDLYKAPLAGGEAQRLTSSNGYEMFARYSPDGKQIAFTGQYDGSTEVYLMPADGGEPTRLTYSPTNSRDDLADRMGPNNVVMAWTPDGQGIVYRNRISSGFDGVLMTVSPTGGMPEQIPLPEGGFCCYSPDGSKLLFYFTGVFFLFALLLVIFQLRSERNYKQKMLEFRLSAYSFTVTISLTAGILAFRDCFVAESRILSSLCGLMILLSECSPHTGTILSIPVSHAFSANHSYLSAFFVGQTAISSR